MLQRRERRHICYDRDLELEAYRLSGVTQKFPNHFHSFYVIGFIEDGRRRLWCGGREYDLSGGDLVLFNPGDSHCCAPVDGEPLDYRAVNIEPRVMLRAAREITGREDTPRFARNVARQSGIAPSLGALCDAVVRRAPRLEREEAFFLLLEQVLREHAGPFGGPDARPSPQIRDLCAYMDAHFAENVTLDDLCAMTSFGKSYLLRAFAKQTGVTPYRYLQAVRLDRAKQFLERGAAPADAASLAGFSDQSHFTRYFKEFTGLTPKQYQRIFKPTPEEERNHAAK